MRRWLVLLFALPAAARGDDPPKPAAKDKETAVHTKHSVTVGGKVLEYEATAGLMPLTDDDGKVQARVFYTAYTKPGADPATRPLLFSFNGGPGSSSVWLHLGIFGPKRVALTDGGEAPPPPAALVDNEATILDLADLVFIDPVGTGFSRAADEKTANKQFHGVQEDVLSVGDFIRLYVTKNQRWGSPKYVAGESYGTTRAAALAGHLQNRLGMRLNGVLLVSAVLNFGTIRFDEGNDLPFVLYLPGYAATAWYHKALADRPADLAAFLTEVEAFAAGEYATALHKGASLTDAERTAVADKVAKYTGLSAEFVKRNDLRVEGQRFMRELLRGRGQTVGRYDSRLLGKDANDAAERPEYDPSYAAVQGPYTEAFNAYVRGPLKYESDLPYEILTGKVQPWNYGPAGSNRYVNVAPTLRGAMAQNPALRVFVANGYYDLATPYTATKYTVDHLGGDAKLRDRVTMAYYEAGHMMYIHAASRAKLRADVAKFLTAQP